MPRWGYGHAAPYPDDRVIISIRHFTDEATERKVHGRSSYDRVVEEGFREAWMLAKQLGQTALSHATATHRSVEVKLYSSNDPQCMQSLELLHSGLTKAVQDTPVKVQPPVVTDKLASFDFGPLNGKRHEELPPEYQQELRKWMQRTRTPDRPPFPEGSEPVEFYNALCLALAEIRKECSSLSAFIGSGSVMIGANAIKHVLLQERGFGLAEDGLPERIPFVDVPHGQCGVTFELGNDQLSAPLPDYLQDQKPHSLPPYVGRLALG